MALEEVVGAIVLEVNGQEIEVADFSVTKNTGTKPVKTMNRKRRVKSFSRGIATFDIKATVIIPLTGDLDWMTIEGAKLTIYPVAEGGQRKSYTDVYCSDIGEQYSVDNEARRDLTLFASDEVIE